MNQLKKLQAFFHPERFQGWGKKRNYFEGWYFKLVSADERSAIAIIPGIAMDKKGNQQAFIQILDGKKKTAVYHRFDADAFIPKTGEFFVQIANNSFSEKHLFIDLSSLKGELRFTGNVPWPKKIYSPGIMGPYAFAPFMECYHGIVSMNHSIKGELLINGVDTSFSGGMGYIEKDWGHSFPSAYFWMQSNHFSKEGISLKCSVAKIPWVTKAFTGFIAGLWLHDKLFRFTTYNGTRLRKSFADEKKIELVLENSRHRLELLAHRDQSTSLASPIGGLMDGRIEESMTAKIEVMLTDKKENTVLLNDTGRNAGLEVAGKIKEIMI